MIFFRFVDRVANERDVRRGRIFVSGKDVAELPKGKSGLDDETKYTQIKIKD